MAQLTKDYPPKKNEPKNSRQYKIFVSELIIDWDHARAYAAAGFKAQNAKRAGLDLAKTDYVQELIGRAIEARRNRLEITADRVLLEEARLAFSDMRKVFVNGVPKKPNELEDDVAAAISKCRIINRTRTDRQGAVTQEQTVEYELWDKGKALQRVSQHLGMYQEGAQNQVNVQFVVCGTPGKSIQECIEEHGSIEIDPDKEQADTIAAQKDPAEFKIIPGPGCY